MVYGRAVPELLDTVKHNHSISKWTVLGEILGKRISPCAFPTLSIALTFGVVEVKFGQITGHRSLPTESVIDLVVYMAEECRQMLDRLGDPNLEALALAKIEGYTNSELAEQADCSVRTIERQLRLIRKKWTQEPAS